MHIHSRAIKYLYFNARSINNKIEDLHGLLEGKLFSNKTFDIIAISETWLNDSHPNSLLTNAMHYNVYRKDRSNRGGGVCLMVNDILSCSRVNIDDAYSHLEILAVDMSLLRVKIRIIVCYNPPNSTNEYVLSLCHCLDKLLNIDYSSVVLGDFNFPNICWINRAPNPETPDYAFYDCCINNGLEQLIDKPTYINSSNILDLLLTNDPNSIYNIQVEEPFSTSDHASITYEMYYQHNTSSKSDNVFDFDFTKGNYELFCQNLASVDWLAFFQLHANIDDQWYAFKDMLYSYMLDIFPLRNNTKRKSTYPSYILKAPAHKKVLWRKRSMSPNGRKLYNGWSNKCRKMIKKYCVNKELKIISSRSPKQFFNYAKKKMQSFTKPGPLSDTFGIKHTDYQNKSEILNKFFCSVFTNDNGHVPTIPTETQITSSDDIDFTPLAIKRALKRIRPSGSAGPDSFPAVFWRNAAVGVAVPLSIIFKNSFQMSTVPAEWRLATVIPIFKKGCPSDPTNYRPISLTCIPCKIMESIIKDHMLRHLESNNLLSATQHGFTSHKSTFTQLVECLHDWTSAAEQHLPVHIVYIDFSKAFDSVSHPKLLYKLSRLGFSDKLITWISAFLNNRYQRVKCGDSFSTLKPVTSGVPQGSVLGPILFLLFINDLAKQNLDCTIKLFADDLKIYKTIRSPLDYISIQNALNFISDWSDTWQLPISVIKCACLILGKKGEIHNYVLSGQVLPCVDNCMDLGIGIDRDLNFAQHISKIVSKAKSRCSLLLKCFISSDANTLVKAYTVYVRPLLEYNCAIWSPYFKKDINLIESVQRYFTRCMYRRLNLPIVAYDERLNVLGLLRLEARRIICDLVETFKLCKGYSCLDKSKYISITNNHSLRGHAYKLYKNRINTRVHRHFLFNRVINIWNVLPSNFFNTNVVASFKRKLETFNFSAYLSGQT